VRLQRLAVCFPFVGPSSTLRLLKIRHEYEAAVQHTIDGRAVIVLESGGNGISRSSLGHGHLPIAACRGIAQVPGTRRERFLWASRTPVIGRHERSEATHDSGAETGRPTRGDARRWSPPLRIGTS